MPLVSPEGATQYYEPFANGPTAQVAFVTGPAANPLMVGGSPTNLPTQGTIAASGNWISGKLISDGYKAISVGCLSTQNGAINIQRYIDRAGLIPVGAVVTAAITGGIAQWATVNDGVAFQSFTVQITNTGASAATVTNFDILMSAN